MYANFGIMGIGKKEKDLAFERSIKTIENIKKDIEI
jgi:hypothetical protein